MAKIPYPHQQRHADKIEVIDKYALWWKPRRGKTLTTVLGLYQAGVKRILILCPTTVKDVWAAELSDFDYEVEVYKAGRKRKNLDCLVMNYESMWSAKANVQLQDYEAVVWDESIRLQNYRSKGVQMWMKNIHKIPKRRILLSGAPCPESILQVAPQLYLLIGGFKEYMDFFEYLYTNWTYNDRTYKWKANTREVTTNLENAMARLGSSLSDEEVVIEVEKVYDFISAEPSRKEKQLFEAIRTATFYKNEDGTKMPLFLQDEDSIRQRVRLYRMASSGLNMLDASAPEELPSSKLAAVRDYIKTVKEDYPEEQFVVFTAFKHTVTNVRKLLNDAGLTTTELTGDVSSKAARGQEHSPRTLNIAKFQRGDVDVIIVNVTVGKMGIDLSKANYLIYAENSYSGDARIQSEERGTRLDKKDTVQVLDCVLKAEPNVDLAVAKSVKGKRDFNVRLLGKI